MAYDVSSNIIFQVMELSVIIREIRFNINPGLGTRFEKTWLSIVLSQGDNSLGMSRTFYDIVHG
eukprot:3878427-Ditylum_brightwellii.AAC.1